MTLLQILERLESYTPLYKEMLIRGLHSLEIEHAINNAAFEVFLQFYKEFEENQYTKFGISNLVMSNELMNEEETSSINTHPNGILYDVGDVYFTVDDFMKVDGKNVPVISITHDYYQSNIKNPMRNPNSDISFWRLDIGSDDNSSLYREIILDKDTYSSIQYYVSYIKLPAKVHHATPTSFLDINDEIIDTKILPLAINTLLRKFSLEERALNSEKNKSSDKKEDDNDN